METAEMVNAAAAPSAINVFFMDLTFLVSSKGF